MLTSVLISLGVVFIAELGDKSQLIAMTYALRQRWWVVLSGVGIAAFLVHGISVTIGHFVGLTLPQRPIAFVAAIAFLGFAVWTWRDRPTSRHDAPTVRETRFALLAVIAAFVLAELGDKTMLATVALASDHDWVGVWVGATAGTVLADAAAITAGTLLHRRLPERVLHILAGLLFLLFGVWMLFDAALGRPAVAAAVTVAVALVAIAVTGVRVVRRRSGASGWRARQQSVRRTDRRSGISCPRAG